MAITYTATASDVARLRLLPSPIGEAVFSLRAIASKRPDPRFAPFFEHARTRMGELDLRMLRALVPGSGYVPDVLTPAPSFAPSFRTQLEALRATRPEEFAAQVAWMDGDPGTDRGWKSRTAGARRLAVQHPERALALVADQLDRYWNAVIDPAWATISAALDQDIRDRTRIAERSGTSTMLGTVNERVRWDGVTLSVRSTYDFTTQMDGGGIALVPSVFSQGEVLTMLPPIEPMLVYPRPIDASIWQASSDPDAADPLGNLLGRVRAKVLRALRTPMTTGALATLAGVTPAAVSQHLGVLRECGLITTERRGRNAVHVLTVAGEELALAAPVALFPQRML
jgi:DNA-binding transcriptional ArsR family regulator